MIKERGFVNKVEGGIAFVRTSQSKKCENCSGKGSCMILEHGDEMVIKVKNTLNARPGDEISLKIGRRSSGAKQLSLFFIAIIALLIGGAAGRFCNRFIVGTIGQFLPAAFGLGSVLISIILWRNYNKQQEQHQQPIMEKIIRSEAQDTHGNQVNLQ